MRCSLLLRSSQIAELCGISCGLCQQFSSYFHCRCLKLGNTAGVQLVNVTLCIVARIADQAIWLFPLTPPFKFNQFHDPFSCYCCFGDGEFA